MGVFYQFLRIRWWDIRWIRSLLTLSVWLSPDDDYKPSRQSGVQERDAVPEDICHARSLDHHLFLAMTQSAFVLYELTSILLKKNKEVCGSLIKSHSCTKTKSSTKTLIHSPLQAAVSRFEKVNLTRTHSLETQNSCSQIPTRLSQCVFSLKITLKTCI